MTTEAQRLASGAKRMERVCDAAGKELPLAKREALFERLDSAGVRFDVVKALEKYRRDLRGSSSRFEWMAGVYLAEIYSEFFGETARRSTSLDGKVGSPGTELEFAL